MEAERLEKKAMKEKDNAIEHEEAGEVCVCVCVCVSVKSSEYFVYRVLYDQTVTSKYVCRVCVRVVRSRRVFFLSPSLVLTFYSLTHLSPTHTLVRNTFFEPHLSVPRRL